jgi:hypothetical protein
MEEKKWFREEQKHLHSGYRKKLLQLTHPIFVEIGLTVEVEPNAK